MYVLCACCIHNVKFLHLGFATHSMGENSGVVKAGNLEEAKHSIEAWVRGQGLREGTVRKIVDSLNKENLLALPRPRTWNRRRTFGVQEHARYLWYRHTAKSLEWQERRKFPEWVGALLKQVVFPSEGLQHASTEGAGQECIGGASEVCTSISTEETQERPNGWGKSLPGGRFNASNRGHIATIYKEKGKEADGGASTCTLVSGGDESFGRGPAGAVCRARESFEFDQRKRRKGEREEGDVRCLGGHQFSRIHSHPP